jgi:hypothetical protein
MKILLDVLPLEKAKHADSDFTEPVRLPFAHAHAGIMAATFQHFHNEGKYSDKYKIKPSSQIISY